MAGEEKKKKYFKVTVNCSWCKKCDICIAFCPVGVFTSDEFGTPRVTYPEKCIGCELCVMRCPDFAVKVEPQDEVHREQKT